MGVLQRRDRIPELGLPLVERRDGGQARGVGRLEGGLECRAQIHYGVGAGDGVWDEADGQATPGVQDRHGRRQALEGHRLDGGRRQGPEGIGCCLDALTLQDRKGSRRFGHRRTLRRRGTDVHLNPAVSSGERRWI